MTSDVPVRIGIVGASVRAALQSARRGGIAARGADLFADADAVRVAPVVRVEHYPWGLADALSTMPVDAWMYTGALENHPQLIEQMARIFPLLGNGPDVLARVRSPQRLEQLLRGTEVHYPAWRRDSDELPTDGSWLVKPLRSAGGGRIAPYVGQDLSPGTEWLFQQRVPGTVAAALYVAAKGKAKLLGVTQAWQDGAWTGARDFAYCGSMGPIEVSECLERKLNGLGAALAQCGVVGLFGVDVVLAGEQVWVLEVNPRYTGSMELLECASGLSLVGLHVRAYREGCCDIALAESRQMVGKAIVYAQRRGTISAEFSARALSEGRIAEEGPHPNPLPKGEGARGCDAWLADIPVGGTEFEGGQPVLTVLARGDDAAEVEEALRQRVRVLQRELGC
jgi:predicted ATP-grasp superfamily ATP-dependent carboligase